MTMGLSYVAFYDTSKALAADPKPSPSPSAKSSPTPSPTPDASQQERIEEKRKELEAAEKKVEEYQEKSEVLGERVKTLKELIREINEDISVTEAAISKTHQQIAETQFQIDKKSAEVDLEEKELDKRREILSEYINVIYHLNQRSTIETLLTHSGLADYLRELSGLGQASQEVKNIYDEIKMKKDLLNEQKARLEEIQEEQTGLKVMQDQQKRYLESRRDQKNQVLEKTQGEESRFLGLLAQGERTTNRLAQELTALQSLGSPIDFKDALRDARYASEKTGVRPEYLLGILRVESNMGNNVGGGSYKTDMHPAQRDYFEAICERLGYDPDNMRVSRKPCYRDEDGNCSGWGGAMGPAQFMPTTWKGYEEKVAELTNATCADPWNLRHALVAMGLKVGKIAGVTSGERSAEYKAANIYLAGGNWERFTWYGDRVMKFTDAFEEKIKEENL